MHVQFAKLIYKSNIYQYLGVCGNNNIGGYEPIWIGGLPFIRKAPSNT